MHKLETKEELERQLQESITELTEVTLDTFKFAIKTSKNFDENALIRAFNNEMGILFKMALIDYIPTAGITDAQVEYIYDVFQKNNFTIQKKEIPTIIDKDYQELIEDFNKFYKSYHFSHTIFPSLVNIREAIQKNITNFQNDNKYLDSLFWSMNYHLLKNAHENDNKFNLTKRDLEAFVRNYKGLLTITASQYAILDLLKTVSELINAPSIKKNDLKINKNALTEYIELADKYNQGYAEIDTIKTLVTIKGLPAKERRKIFNDILKKEDILYGGGSFSDTSKLEELNNSFEKILHETTHKILEQNQKGI